MAVTKFDKTRLRCAALSNKVMNPHDASLLIQDGMVIGVSGFTPSGYPKAVPLALAKRARESVGPLKVSLYSGASLGPEVDEAWTEAGIIKKRFPYQTTNALRKSINEGDVEFSDFHLSHFPQYIDYGMVPPLDIAIVEALAITEDGDIIPTLGIGSTPNFIRNARKVIVEINLRKPLALEGMADIYRVGRPPFREPIPLKDPGQRIGTTFIPCGPEKIAAVVMTDMQDQTRGFKKCDDVASKISSNILAFLREEVRAQRLSEKLLPLQSGVGDVANAVLIGLKHSEFHDLTFYTEVVQDSMLELLRSGKAKIASTTALSPSPEELVRFERELDFFKDRIILRPQEISNNPEIIRRLGVISMNTALEIDIYGNVNSTHIAGTKIMNGIGGSGDFARNAYISIFSTESTAMKGNVSSIVPMVSHVDHTEHDVMVVVTEQGYADIRGLSPKERAKKIIENCANPKYKPMLWDYFIRSCEQGVRHTPHILSESLSWHKKFLDTGSMI